MASIVSPAKTSIDATRSRRVADGERVLVCMLASTRASELTFTSIKRHVLDELNADLALAILTDETYDPSNPFWRLAKYRWTSRTRADYGEAYDEVQQWLCRKYNVAPPDWRVLLGVDGIWLGGIKSPTPRASVSSILPYCRWLLLRHLQEEGVLDRYDRFVITRSDFYWLSPHPPLSILDRNFMWVPDGENWDGVNDRHLVVSRTHVIDCLNLIEDIVLHPADLYQEMRDRSQWNNEQFLAHHLGRKGLLERVRTFPYVMYTARSKHDNKPTWSYGRYEPAVGHYVKYQYEYQMASAYAPIIRSREDWERKDWVDFDPATLPAQKRSLLRRTWYAYMSAYYRFLDACRRPGRAGRFRRFFKWKFQNLVSWLKA
jgi:hypothetical protein